MKLMTHNFLASNVPGVNNGYPLKLTATQVESREVEFRPEFVTNVWGRIDYKVLRDAAASIGHGDQLPIEPDPLSNEDFVKQLHHVLLEIEVIEGSLVCPETNRVFPIVNGIPNMLLADDEI